MVAPCGMRGVKAPLPGSAALALWGAQYAPARARTDSAAGPAIQRSTLPRRTRVVVGNPMALRSFGMKMKWATAGNPAVARPDRTGPLIGQAIGGPSVY